MYNRQYWQDHVTQYENRYREQVNPDGTITHIPIEGEVLQEGTPQNATNFNNLETGIFSAHELNAELTRITLEQQRRKTLVISENRPDGDWKLWLQIEGEVPGYPEPNLPPAPTTVMLDTAPLDAGGDFTVMYDDGSGETVLDMTDNPETASYNDIIIVTNE